MFTLWAKIFKRSRLLKDLTITDDSADSRTAKVVHAVTQVCHAFDLAEPLWLDANIREFQKRSRTRFSQDNFIETVDFDYLEIQVIEEE